jgi:hypothetical protein
MDDPKNESDREPAGEPKSGSKAMKWVIGCGVALVLSLGCCLGGGYFAIQKGIDFTHARLVETVRASELPDDQVESVVSDLGRLRDAAKDGNLDFEKVGTVDQEVERALMLGFIVWYETSVVESTDLSVDEKADARRQLQRLARGLDEETLTQGDIQRLDIRVQAGTEEGWDVESVRREVARVKELVDENGIVDEPYQADVAAKFTEIVDALIE